MVSLVTCAPEEKHPGVHRLDEESGLPACKTGSWGRPHPVVSTIGTARDDSALAARDVLVSLNLPVCRMCRRCWRGAPIPAHDRRTCFGRRPGI